VVALLPHDARRVADVGAGHGALSAHLARREGLAVVATEAKPGPFAELGRNLDAWDARDLLELRMGSGLDPLVPGEVDAVVVAGLSARTAISVCAQARRKRLRWMVIQCVQRPDQLQRWLAEQRWPVLARTEVEERRRSYTTWLVEVPA
jgi:tRNA (adenine22-N1)-methyltransferase